MESAMLERIRLVLSMKSISVNALAKQIGIAQATLNPQLRGDRALSARVVEKILDLFSDVSAEWVFRGKGEVLLEDFCSKENKDTEKSSELNPKQVNEDTVWKAKYEELEKRYGQLLSILGGGMK